MNEFKYEIGGKVYIQKPLVLGQIKQLTNLLQGVVIPEDFDMLKLISILGNKLPEAIAICIIPQGISLKDKDIKALAEELENEITPEMAVQVIEDFFACNQIALIFKKLNQAIEKMTEKVKETGLTSSVLSSQAGTSLSETV